MCALMHTSCSQTGRGSDMINGCQTIVNPLTSTATYIFPFRQRDVFDFVGSDGARNLHRFPIQADAFFQRRHWGRDNKKEFVNQRLG